MSKFLEENYEGRSAFELFPRAFTCEACSAKGQFRTWRKHP